MVQRTKRRDIDESKLRKLKIGLLTGVVVIVLLVIVKFIFDIIKPEQSHSPEWFVKSEIINTDTSNNLSLDWYVETSGSMKGYFQSNNVVTDLLTHLSALDGFGSVNMYCQDGKKWIKSLDFISQLKDNKVNWSGTSFLHDEIADIISSSKKNKSDIMVLVTDGIMSASSGEMILRNVENYKIQIRDIISKETEYGVSVYQFMVPFDGVYCDYNNRGHDINQNRPLYAIAFGKPESLVLLRQKMSELEDEQLRLISGQWHSIDRLPVRSSFSVRVESGKEIVPLTKCDVHKGGDSTCIVHEFDFDFGTLILDLEKNIFRNNVVDFNSLKDLMSVVVDGETADTSSYIVDAGGESLKIKIIVDSLEKPLFTRSEVEIVIMNKWPDWVVESCLDKKVGDTDISKVKNKTIFLKELMSGIRDGQKRGKRYSDTLFYGKVILEKNKKK